MMAFRHVSRINVSLWGRRVGTLVAAPQRGVFAFRYEKGFLASGIEIAPLMMPLRAEPYVFADLPRLAYDGLPPIFADSLPDAFGTGLVDHWLQGHGLARDEITPLDRLAYLGRRTMGALTYEPDRGPGGCPTAIDMRNLVESARRVLNGELVSATGEDALREKHRRYEQLFMTADALGLGYEAREQLFRRMAFNVIAGECDDHPKNFAFRLRQGGSWALAPAYDLTGSDFPSCDPWRAHAGTHQLSVNGRRRDISDEDLLAVADRFGIGTARRVLAEIRAAWV